MLQVPRKSSLRLDVARLAILPLVVWLLLPVAWPRWAWMWMLAIAIYAGCKWLTWHAAPKSTIPWWRHVAYLVIWPGLDAHAFLKPRPLPRDSRPSPAEWLFAASKLLLGVGLFWGASRLIPASQPLALGWIGMLGMVFILHFGVFHLLSCLWRTAGIDARPLMDWPIAARSVSEFWGNRWNMAFRDVTHRFLFRPLTVRFGARWAVAAGFLASGVLHDLVISIPAEAGYGLPTLYFLLQGGALFVERSKVGKWLGLGSGWRGWVYTAAAVLLPAGLLFHPPFVTRVVVPFMRVLGASPIAALGG